MIRQLTVLYDADCPTCVRARMWLEHQVQLVPIEFIAAGSDVARQRYPSLDHALTMQKVTVVSDGGLVYQKDRAWIVLLWALAHWRDVADRMASPVQRPFVRSMVSLVDGWRMFHKRRLYAGPDGFSIPAQPKFHGADCRADDGCSAP